MSELQGLQLADRPKSPSLLQRAKKLFRVRLVLAMLCSIALTGIGFFIESAWLWVAYLPFLFALITTDRGLRGALVAGHFAVIAAISCWGLIALGYTPWAVIVFGSAASLLLGAIFSVLGVGLASVLLLAIPYFPGNPLLIAGTLYPGTGFTGLILLVLGTLLVSFWKTSLSRAATMFFLCMPSIFLWDLRDEAAGRYFGIAPEEDRVTALAGFEIQPIGLDGKQMSRWDMQRALNDLPEGSTIVTGENALKAQDGAALRALCRVVRVRDLTLYLGVQGADGRAQIRRLDQGTCDDGALVYTAALGIPGLTGPVLPEVGMLNIERIDEAGEAVPDFLACFEAFSIHRWIALATHQASSVIAVSNDSWTDPLPIAALRVKVSAQLARLFQIDIAHTNTAAPSVWLLREGP